MVTSLKFVHLSKSLKASKAPPNVCSIPCFLLIIFRVLLFPRLLPLYKKRKIKYFHLHISGNCDFRFIVSHFHASIFVLHFALLPDSFFFRYRFSFRFWKCFRSLKNHIFFFYLTSYYFCVFFVPFSSFFPFVFPLFLLPTLYYQASIYVFHKVYSFP